MINWFKSAAGLGAVLFVAAMAIPDLARAADAQSEPDFSGFWALNTRAKPSEASKALLAEVPKDAVLLADVGAPEFPAGVFGGLKLSAKAKEKVKDWTPNDEYEPRNVCRRPSIIYAMQGPFPLEVHQADKLIIIQLEYFDMVRIVFMDGRDHPGPDQPHSMVGHSVGHWEGDELVVDTTHLESATITANGLDHSENVHVVERFRMDPDGKTLWALQVFSDPEMIENSGARLISWSLVPGQHVYPYECDPFQYSDN